MNIDKRNETILRLARQIYNYMGFACQGAENGNERQEYKYQTMADQSLTELEELLGSTDHSHAITSGRYK